MTCCSTGLATAYTVTRPGRSVCYASCWRSCCCRLNAFAAGVPDAAAVDQQYCKLSYVSATWLESTVWSADLSVYGQHVRTNNNVEGAIFTELFSR